MKLENNYCLFWSGPFSQWYRSDMKIDGKKFNCCEQYMMYKKAMLFKDTDMAKKIMKTNSPKEQKAFGRKVKNFNVDKWNSVCQDIIYIGNLNKFQQNKKLKEILLSYDEDVEFVEASPVDNLYGIGLTEDNPKAWNKETWQGKNWLGIAITRARNTILELDKK